MDGNGRQLLCVGARCQPAQCLLWPLLVVFPALGFDDGPGVQQVGEPVLVETLVAQAAVEGFDVGVLVRFAGLDQAQLHAAFARQVTMARIAISVSPRLGAARANFDAQSIGVCEAVGARTWLEGAQLGVSKHV